MSTASIGSSIGSQSQYPPYLTPDQLAQFDRDGYLVIKDFFSQSLAQSLKAHSDSLLKSLDLSSHPLTVFTANGGEQIFGHIKSAEPQKEDENSVNDRYFLNSADSVGFFFESGAFDGDGRLTREPHLAINKIGHYLHVLDPQFREFTYGANVKSIVSQLGFIDPVVLQSMLIFKQPFIGGIVDKHRDSTFLYTEPSTAIGFWLTLETATEENGCLRFVKGSHRDQSTRRFRRAGTVFKSINNVPVHERASVNVSELTGPDNTHVKTVFTGSDERIEQYRDDEWTVEPVPAGSLVIIHGDVAHASSPNLSADSRFIYTFHCIDDANTVYSEHNWLQSNKEFPHLFR